MALYKKNNYSGNSNYRNNRNNNERNDRHFGEKPSNYGSNPENNYSEILDYLKKPEDSKKYKLFSMDGIISKDFAGVPGGSQMRKFYDNVVDIYNNAREMESSKGRLAMMLPIAYYANQRGFLNRRLFDFIKQSIKELNSMGDADEFKRSLEAFKDVFQAVVAYTK
ncbi:type III-A CRISPR-associated protein Csm2 [Acidiplasma aeolicum]|uniref:type III-A CRISPR-associated protein Csm2 n=1 Tax=Acidiplasma aeolicum TaxID=507754 RepID=UPI00371FDED1